VDVGEYLLSLGHRGVAYFSPYCDTRERSPVQSRKEGVEEAFRGAGYGEGVKAFLCDQFESEADAAGAYLQESTYRSLQEVSTEYLAAIDAIDPRPEYFFPPTGMTYPLVHQYHWYQFLLPRFEEALSDRSVTAWVGFNDTVALLAYSFLLSNGIKVPEDISVIGFDDTIASYGYNLSSYNFNVDGMITEALDHIIRFRPGHNVQRTLLGSGFGENYATGMARLRPDNAWAPLLRPPCLSTP
jgi:DNA-binding LacI/PurR family transcriptional regulator